MQQGGGFPQGGQMQQGGGFGGNARGPQVPSNASHFPLTAAVFTLLSARLSLQDMGVHQLCFTVFTFLLCSCSVSVMMQGSCRVALFSCVIQYLSTGLHDVLLTWVFLLHRVACRVVCSKEEEEVASAAATRPTATRMTWMRRVHTSLTKLPLL